MINFWWAWQNLHVGERLLLGASVLLLTFCAGFNWQTARVEQDKKLLLLQPLENKLIKWDSQASIIVDVVGKVRHPGIVRVPQGSRVQDAIRQTGGILPDVNSVDVNFAALLSDGQQVRVGVIDMKPAKSTFGTAIKINVNQANVTELLGLPDIGPVIAQRIVEYRKKHGRFHRVDELDAVKGIGVKTLKKLAPLISFY